jgi:hypothetical protein
MKGLCRAVAGTAARPGPTAEISGGLAPIRGRAIQSRISKGTTAMFEATP